MGMLSVSGAFIGAGLGFIVSSVMESAVSTVFVCFAEDPKVCVYLLCNRCVRYKIKT